MTQNRSAWSVEYINSESSIVWTYNTLRNIMHYTLWFWMNKFNWLLILINIHNTTVWSYLKISTRNKKILNWSGTCANTLNLCFQFNVFLRRMHTSLRPRLHRGTVGISRDHSVFQKSFRMLRQCLSVNRLLRTIILTLFTFLNSFLNLKLQRYGRKLNNNFLYEIKRKNVPFRHPLTGYNQGTT